jgi:hypothetical protein
VPWISVRNWRTFQHYDPAKRIPPWIKNHTELMSRDDYLELNAGARSVLHGIWLEYASSQCRLRFDSVLLGRRLNLRVTKQHLETLVSAGWIDVVASATLAEGYHDASVSRAHVEVEVEEEEDKPPNPNPAVDVEDDELLAQIRNGTVVAVKNLNSL